MYVCTVLASCNVVDSGTDRVVSSHDVDSSDDECEGDSSCTSVEPFKAAVSLVEPCELYCAF